MPIVPRPEQLTAFAKGAPAEGPLRMLNLLRYKERAEYADGRETELSGREAYALYGQGVSKIIGELGGRLAFAGRCQTLLIGDGDLAWDDVAIVEYPSLDAFRKMTGSAEYAAVHVHREAGLAHQLLIHCLGPEQTGASAFSAPA
jgi:uncharacterized protein (DUF1330 family)